MGKHTFINAVMVGVKTAAAAAARSCLSSVLNPAELLISVVERLTRVELLVTVSHFDCQ